MGKWIGVDLDGTLARSNGKIDAPIGAPLQPMLLRVQNWIKTGYEVRIFTARADSSIERKKIEKWLNDNGIGGLAITNKKDWQMIELWDDRAIRVKHNMGKPCNECEHQTQFTQMTDC
jgi:hypothetical protein